IQKQSNQITLSQNDLKKLMETVTSLKGSIAREDYTLKRPSGPGKQKADNITMDQFLDYLLQSTDLLGENYDYDPVEDLRLQFEQLEINQ
ncbi:9875_t:CDS:1, partial [Diversispora eburnea]